MNKIDIQFSIIGNTVIAEKDIEVIIQNISSCINSYFGESSIYISTKTKINE